MHRSEFHYARSHENADNEVTSHRSEILPPFVKISLWISCKRALNFEENHVFIEEGNPQTKLIQLRKSKIELI